MAEYIEREALERCILGLTIVDPAVAQYANAVLQCLKDAPAADVAAVVHGRWEFRPFYKGTSRGVIECQVCKGAFDGSVGLNYCPHCGAKMDLEG